MGLLDGAGPFPFSRETKGSPMLKSLIGVAFLTLGVSGPVMAQERILISSEWGEVTAVLSENDAAQSLARMLPLTIELRDHLRQEKTGKLPSALPDLTRQQDFAAGTLEYPS